MKIYLANGLFSEADRDFNKKLADTIKHNLKSADIYLPQDNYEINDKSNYADSVRIAEADMKHLKEADVLVAVIDGVEIDSGVAAKIGAFHITGKPIFALCTDIRTDITVLNNAVIEGCPFENQLLYRNLFVIGLIKHNGGSVVSNIDTLVFALQLKYYN